MILGFLQDIVRGAREFRRSVDSIEHQRDAKARATKPQECRESNVVMSDTDPKGQK